jgi:competence protein ComEC
MRICRFVGSIPFDLVDRDDGPEAPLLGGVRPRRRSLWAVAALAAGFALARTLADTHEGGAGGWIAAPAPTTWFAVCQGVLAASLLARGTRCRVLLWIAAALFAGGWYTLRLGPGPAHRLDVVLAPMAGDTAPILATVHGVALEDPRRVEPRVGVLGRFARAPASWVFEARAQRLEAGDAAVHVSGVVRVTIRAQDGEEAPAVRAGEALRVTGEFRPVAAPMNPGEPDRVLLARQDGIVGRVIVPRASLVERTGLGPVRGAPAGFIAWARGRAAGALDLNVSEAEASNRPGRALLAAMLLGSREPGLDEVDTAFRRVGLVHLVAISGFNLSLLAWAASLLLRVTGDRGRLETLGVAALIGLYLLIVPAESPVLRAGVTVLAFLLTEAMGRRYDRLTLLGWVAFALLLWRPLDLWSLGFQLSFGIVAVLLWLGRRVEDRLFGVALRGVVSVGIPIGERPGLLVQWARAVGRTVGGAGKTALSASLLAWGTAAPVIAVHTGVLSPWAPLTGLAALPIASATLCVGYLALLIGFVWPAAGAAIGEVAVWGADLLAAMIMGLDGIPGASIGLPRLSAPWGVAAVGVVLFWFARGRWRSRWAWGLTAAAAVWFGAEVTLNTGTPRGVALRVDTFAVGDGTCHLVRAGDEALLWDCGSSHPGLGLRELPRAVRAVGGWRVRTAVVTHANLDHFLCLPDVVGPLGIERVHVTPAFLREAAAAPAGAAASLLERLAEQGVRVIETAAGDRVLLGGATCEFLSPAPGDVSAEANDTSLVGLFRIGSGETERRVLLTGDIGPRAIGDLRDRFPGLRVDAMELPHHGSAKPEAIALVGALDPALVVQSTGPQRLGDARWDGVRPARAWGVTARDGALWLEIGRDGAMRAGSIHRAGVTTVR